MWPAADTIGILAGIDRDLLDLLQTSDAGYALMVAVLCAGACGVPIPEEAVQEALSA